jgi:hypothetical protein
MMCGLDLELGINRNTRESKRSRKKRGEKYSLLTEIIRYLSVPTWQSIAGAGRPATPQSPTKPGGRAS